MVERKGRNGGTLMSMEKGDKTFPGAGRPPKSDILKEVAEMMEGDGWAVIEGDLLGEDGKPTGQTVKVRARVANMKDAARAWAAQVKKASPKHLEMYLKYTIGLPKQQLDLTTNGESLNKAPLERLSPEKQAEVLRLLNADS